ncbi:MAG: prepilin-type N-terminal cleavage/methylation domain-containing protein [Acidobacteria bacterium]|nr:prepilin-type N-terminal cleavage/methylation domain-containing protein [Acidobacteriota bacterium]
MRGQVAASRGFTLLESMIALLVLTTGLLGTALLFVIAVQQNSYGRANTMAISVAVDRLENLRSEYNSDLNTGVTSSDLTAGSHGPVTVGIAGDSDTHDGAHQYIVSWTVTPTGGQQMSIVVTVQPASANVKENRPVQLTGYMAP